MAEPRMTINGMVSSECYHYMCSACTYEDCACLCHSLPPMEALEALEQIGEQARGECD